MQKVSSLIGWRTFAIAAVALMAAAAAALNVAPTTLSAAPTTYMALAGGDGPGQAAYINVFEPTALIITEGDSVQWKVTSGEPHTVLFLNNQPPPKEINLDTLEDPIGGLSPSYDGTKQIYSGFIVPDPKSNYTVKFTKAGNYPFICLIHPGMDGSVTVLSPGLYVPTQAQIDADGKKVQAAGEAATRRMIAAAPTAATRSASGWTVPASPYLAVPGGFVAQNLFTPARISIGAGDTVTWMGDIPQAHTVTFTGGGPPAGDPTQPTKAKSYTGGFASSGLLGKAPGVGPELFTGGTSFSLTFPNPGTYTYICILHIDQGMAGVVEVGAPGSGGAAPGGAIPAGGAPAGGAPIVVRPPATGDGGLANSTAAAWPLALAVAFAGIATLGVMRARARI